MRLQPIIKKLFSILFFIQISFVSFSQSGTVKGLITDTINHKNLSNTVISLLRKDSVITSFRRSNESGFFEIKNIKPGNYLLYITHPTYADYTDKIEVTDANTTDLGSIKMTLLSHLLEEVMVKQKISAIRINGDTTEFKSDSFKVREGASVEEMLRKLPGIQVDKDGKITAMGEQVKKVLVDGEEFFGDDPTIATRNLQASDVDKVQVFDKKSDQATFSGIDDGQHEKTINLKIKADKKNGYFGKVELSSGLNNRWNNSLMLNKFQGKQKLSAYGIMSSTGKTGLDWDERGKFGSSGDNPEYDEDNGGFMWTENGDEFSNPSYYGEGLPKSWSGGLNYSNKFNDDRQSLNGNYRFTKLNTTGVGNNISQLTTGTNIFTTKENGSSFASRQRQSLDGTYDWTIDSLTSLKVKANSYVGKTNSLTNNYSEATNELGNISNQSIRNTFSSGDNNKIVASALLRRKFNKKGRTFSVNIEQVHNESKINSNLYADIKKADGSGTLLNTLTDQQNINKSNTSSFNAKFTYTEPLSTKIFAEINYAIRNTSNDAERLTYNKDAAGKYAALNDTFSNHYKFNILTNTGGLSLKLNEKKINIYAGTNIASADFKQTDVFRANIATRNFINFFPRGGITYKFNQSSRLSVQYNGSTKQPTINQIQPVQDNSNPLNITIGNANLKQEFNHNINMNLNSYKVMSQRGFFMYGGLNVLDNAIVTNSSINDTSGKTINQYINASGNYNYYSGINYYIKLVKLNANVNIGFNMNGSRFNSFVNDLKNTTINKSPGFELGFGAEKEKKYNLYVNYRMNFNMASTIVTNTVNTYYWTMNPSFNLNYQMPWKMELNVDGDFNVRQRTTQFADNNNVFLVNAYIGRKLLKNDKAIIKFIAHDVFNQNQGYSRFVSANQVSERNYQTITRFFMLSFLWNFTKKAPAPIATDAVISK